jgi:UDP-N-acetylmuramoyl-L-alanyl-D-glutamate--2,6-diaminopimelate ligase
MITLGDLVTRGLARRVWGDPSTIVSGVRHDSRAIAPGDLFVAMSGRNVDGTRYIDEALARGALAIAAETRVGIEVPQLEVENARRALGALAAAVYGDPTRSLIVIGITGTNGKTTTAWILDEALRTLGFSPALLGTVESRGPGPLRAPASFTTPEGDEIARFARTVLDGGATHLVMEVSSHALAQHRVDAVAFDVAAFSNLTQDHLDFHATMEAYFEAKARLFTDLDPRASVVNVDDPHGAELAHRARGKLVRVSRNGPTELWVRSWSMGRDGIRVEIERGQESVELASPMIGAHNVDNLLLALGCLSALDIDLASAARALGATRGAPGRLERVEGSADVMVLVDYAHTPDALARALAALRPITPGRLFVVFGCGGDRDRQKRPLMGEAAARGADVAIVTSDNPRTEDPSAILAAIEPGVIAGGLSRQSDLASGYDVCEDRREAIRRAVFAARPGDTVLIAGKGHEDYQIRGTTKVHFDDREEAGAAIAARGGREA